MSLEVGVSRAVVPLAERPRSADSPARASSGCLTSVRAPSGVRGAGRARVSPRYLEAGPGAGAGLGGPRAEPVRVEMRG